MISFLHCGHNKSLRPKNKSTNMDSRMWTIVAVLGVVAVGVAGRGTAMGRRVHRSHGIMARRERRRITWATTFATMALMWPCVYAVGGVVEPSALVVIPLAWPIAMILVDLAQTGGEMPARETLKERMGSVTGSGSWLVGAIWAAAMLLQVVTGRSGGHTAATGRTMLVGLLLVIAFLVPTPGAPLDADLTWAAHAVQRSLLHYAVGLFLSATLFAAANVQLAPRGEGVPLPGGVSGGVSGGGGVELDVSRVPGVARKMISTT